MQQVFRDPSASTNIALLKFYSHDEIEPVLLFLRLCQCMLGGMCTYMCACGVCARAAACGRRRAPPAKFRYLASYNCVPHKRALYMSKREREDGIAAEAAAQPTAEDDAPTAAAKKKSKPNATLTDKIVDAIRTLKSPTGSSIPAIQKMILSFNGSPTAFKNAVKKAVEKGILIKNKNSFLVAGDPVYEDASEKVVIEDMVIGQEGESVQTGDTCSIYYVGTLQSNGKRFDSSKSFSFTVGTGDVIKGMDKGVKGMKVGGRRRVVIPPSLGYGKRGSAPDIPPDATLCFDIKLNRIVRE